MGLRSRVVKWFFKNSPTDVKRALFDLYPSLANQILILSSQNPQEAKSTYGDTGYASYAQGAWVHRAINVWAETISSLPVHVVNARSNKEIKLPIIDRLLKMPNENTTAVDFWQRWALDMGARGEFGCEVTYTKGGQIAEMYHHSPDNFYVRVDKARQVYGGIKGYVVQAKFSGVETKEYFLTPDKFIHWKFYNPQNTYRGLSRISALKLTVRGMLFAELWNDDFFRNNARPDMILTVPQGLTPRERKERYKEIQDDFGYNDKEGKSGHGKFFIAESGIEDVKPVSFPPKDIEWLNFLGYGREAIGSVFGVPKEYMFYGTDTYENLDKAEQLLWTGTVIPLTIRRDDQLTTFFRKIGYLNSNEEIRTDLRDVKALIRVNDPAYNQAKSAFAMGVPFNLIDQHFEFGYPRFEGDDRSYPGGGSVSISSEVNNPADNSTGEQIPPEEQPTQQNYDKFSKRNGYTRHAVLHERSW